MGKRTVRMVGVVVVTAALVMGAAAAVAVSAPTVDQRTDAADRGQAAEPAWMRALRIRSEALNRIYGLQGGERRPGARATVRGAETSARRVAPARPPRAAETAWMRALRIRGEALNRALHGS
jgi:hypothetical protein